MNYEKIDALVASMKDELIADMKRWIAIPSVQSEPLPNAPFGAENRRMLDMALADAKKYGFEVRDFDGYAGDISFGSGDFSIFVHPTDGYIYLYYNIIKASTELRRWTSCDIYVARTRQRSDGIMGDFVKFYDGAFSEAGNLGKETPVALGGWHPRMVYLQKYGKYLLSASLTRPKPNGGMVNPIMKVWESDDMLHWSEPVTLTRDGGDFGGHYCGMYARDTQAQPNIIADDELLILTNGNGTDVTKQAARIRNL